MAPDESGASEDDIPEVCREEMVAWESHSTKVAEALLESYCQKGWVWRLRAGLRSWGFWRLGWLWDTTTRTVLGRI
nr:hypothetical protein CFP56_06792 [Quercus suber]